MEAYAAINKNVDILNKSSSGGIFYEFAKYVLDQQGIVFGAAWNEEWLVDMIYIDNIKDIEKLQGSKYVKANNKNTFKECKEFLDNEKLVLYSGTPCQILSLKKYLGKAYENLYTISIACYGTLPLQIWKDYLESIKRPNTTITEIKMRSKENTNWNNYNFVIKYSDNYELIENHLNNKYSKIFISGNYFNNSCYKCAAKNNLQGDIILGDYWGVEQKHKLDTKLGVGFLLANNIKGEQLLNNIKSKIILEKTDINHIKKYNKGIQSNINNEIKKYDKSIFKKKVAILTMNLHFNIGTALQAYALQQIIKSYNFECDILTFDRPDRLSFCDKNISLRILKNKQDFYSIKESDYDIYIVGSDQVWRKNTSENDYKDNYINIPFLQFTNNWTKVRFSYAASFGTGDTKWQYLKNENKQISKILNYFNDISVREIESVLDCKKYLDLDVTQHIDPTLLISKDKYLALCAGIQANPNRGIFKYILYNTPEKENNLKSLNSKLKLKSYTHDKNNVENWLACIRDANIIFTDSYHGVLFSIILNKPFIYYDTRDSGNIRFKTIEKLFNISDRNIANIDLANLDINILKNPNIDYNNYINISLAYIQKNLNSDPKKLITTSLNSINYSINKKQGWVLFLSSDNYLYYVLNVYKNLIDTKTIYPVYCGYTSQVSQKTINILNKVGIYTVLLDTTLDLTNLKLKQIKNWVNAFTKLALLKNPFKLDKMIYLDSDLGIYKNIDELMTKPHMSAVLDGAPLPNRKPGPYQIGDSIFCSGLFVWDFKSNNDNTTLLNSLKNLPIDIEWHDQNVLNYFYKTWDAKLELHLPFIYGLMTTKTKFNFVKNSNDLDKVKIIHYIAGQGEKTKIPFINSKFYLQSWCDMPEVDNYYKEINNSINYFNYQYKLDIPLINTINIIHPTTSNNITTNNVITKDTAKKSSASVNGRSSCYLYF